MNATESIGAIAIPMTHDKSISMITIAAWNGIRKNC